LKNLAMMVQDVLTQNPYGGHLFVFRGKRADRIKVLWWDGTGPVRTDAAGNAAREAPRRAG
jgi:transposase